MREPRTIARWLCLLAAFAVVNPTAAHPVPRDRHDRTITVRLTRDAVIVEYRLELDEWTAVFEDMKPFADKVDRAKLTKPQEFYAAFLDIYAPILAENLVATLDGKPLTFTCVRRKHEVVDHLRCDFEFRAAWQPDTTRPNQFRFREGNYETQSGLIQLALASDATVALVRKTEPDEALKKRPEIEWGPGDEQRLRKVSATFTLTAAAAEAPSTSESDGATEKRKNALLALLDSDHGIWLLLLLAAGFGAAHALTPGHGKTLVAAYLVGARGTVMHAIVLGVVTTLTHTGIVILLAAGLLWFFPDAVPAHVQTALGLGGGLLVAGVGLWLLLRRLTGGADHIHIGGGHHHHHEHDPLHHPLPADGEKVGWGSLIVLGMSGGIVPCWDAIAMLGFAIFAQRLWLGLPLLLAFSAGLAGVLVLIGVLVVYMKGFADSRFGESRFFKALPVVSALLVMLLGLWLCYESVPGH